MDFQLAMLQNSTTNGRVFCALLVVINLAAFLDGYGARFAVLAMLSAIPVGLAVIVDLMPDGKAQTGLGVLTMLIPALVAVSFIFMIG